MYLYLSDLFLELFDVPSDGAHLIDLPQLILNPSC